ncbi:unnamed protein product [Ixodes persulcatus]
MAEMTFMCFFIYLRVYRSKRKAASQHCVCPPCLCFLHCFLTSQPFYPLLTKPYCVCHVFCV